DGEHADARFSRGGAVLQVAGPEPALCRIELFSLDARLEVLVTDDEHTPISGAIVDVDYGRLQQVTDASGRAHFEAMPRGSFKVEVPRGAEARADVCFPTDCHRSALLERDGTTGLPCVIPRCASLEVRLAPAVNASAELEVYSRAAGFIGGQQTIEPGGAAKLDGLPPGEYAVAARFGADSPWDASQREILVLGVGEQRVYELPAKRLAGALRGRVVDDARQPVAGATVSV